VTFRVKNISYGKSDNAFYNFTEAARRLGKVSPFEVLLLYMHKHIIALENQGLYDTEAGQRLVDLAVYSLIGIAMLEAQNKSESPNTSHYTTRSNVIWNISDKTTCAPSLVRVEEDDGYCD
ncbi:hypothetical protein H5T51_04940, partial [Candidatus Bathyarchaeota archaeon]|nr:hypothetical protein [Candidatus Bathyarchaeota archaeon]